MPLQSARVQNYRLPRAVPALVIPLLVVAVLALRVPMVRAEVAKPVIRGLSVSQIAAHGALLEASFNSAKGLRVHAAFVLRYSPCARCSEVRDLRFEGGLGLATGRTLTLRAELADLPAGTRQSVTVSVTAETPPRSEVRASVPELPPRGPIIVENAAEAPILYGTAGTPLQEAPERVSVESSPVSFVTLHSDPTREARRRRAFDADVTRAINGVASQIRIDFQHAPRGHRLAYPLIGTNRVARVVEYKLVSALHEPLGQLSLEGIYTRRPKSQLHSVFVWEKLHDASYSFLFEARRVGTSDWSITRVGCTCRTASTHATLTREESPLTTARFEPVTSYARAVLRDVHRRVLPEAFSPSAEPPLWNVGGPARPAVAYSENPGFY